MKECGRLMDQPSPIQHEHQSALVSYQSDFNEMSSRWLDLNPFFEFYRTETFYAENRKLNSLSFLNLRDKLRRLKLKNYNVNKILI